MKKLLSNRFIKTACNLCLAFSAAFAFSSVSAFIFGEPKFPNEE